MQASFPRGQKTPFLTHCGNVTQVDRSSVGPAAMFARVLKQDGLPGLYRGVFARVAWLAPSAGIMITVFEFFHAQ